MTQVLNWFFQHSTMLIIGLSCLIVLFILALIFRLFFIKQSVDVDNFVVVSGQGNGAQFSGVGLSGQGSSSESELLKKVELLQQELSKAKEESTAAKAELEVKSGQSVIAEGATVATADPALNEKLVAAQAKVDELGQKNTHLINEIKDLKEKLSDFEIIAEDIADLQRLKNENEELKKQLSQNSSGVSQTVIQSSQENNSSPSTSEVQSNEVKNTAASGTKESQVNPDEVTNAKIEESFSELLKEMQSSLEPTNDIKEEKLSVEVTENKDEVPALESLAPTEESLAEETLETNATSGDTDLTASLEDLSSHDNLSVSDLNDVNLNEESSEIPDPESAVPLNNEETQKMSEGVSQESKDLLDAFEKNFSKGEES